MPIITVNKLSKSYRAFKKEPGVTGSLKTLFKRDYYDVKAVKDISFEIEEGELIGFIGPNGAGKTTTLKTLSGLLHPSGGDVNVLGFTPFDRKYAFLKQISLVMGQKNQLLWDLPSMETFLLNKAIYDIDQRTFQSRVDSLIDMLDVADIVNVQVRKLSLGQRMKCELIAALLHNPKILFLDEPTIGMDVVMQQKLREFIKQYNQRYKATIILTSHYMKDVKELCDRVIIIDHGSIKFDGELKEIIKTYKDSKYVKIIFTEPTEVKQFEKYGTIVTSMPTRIVLEIPQDKLNKSISHILNSYDVEDLIIEEPEIEQIIADVFSRKVAYEKIP